MSAARGRRTCEPIHDGAQIVAAAVLALLALVPPIATAIGETYYVTLFTRILILALAAVGLNLILGYGGLVSFGHAMYIGIGAYAVASCALRRRERLDPARGRARRRCRRRGRDRARVPAHQRHGVHHDHARVRPDAVLPRHQLEDVRRDDGLTINARSDFGLFSLRSNVALYYFAYVVLIASLLGLARLVHSRFGMVIRGGRSNERRMAALGFPMLRYKLTAYVISALVCVVAGVLLANLTKFAAPSYMAWQASGDLIVMIVLGGWGRCWGRSSARSRSSSSRKY
jgi:branched-chain amino acid transport system permease protein